MGDASASNGDGAGDRKSPYFEEFQHEEMSPGPEEQLKRKNFGCCHWEGFGPRQFGIFAVVNLCDYVTAWTIMIPIFIGTHPTWKCPSPSIASYNATGLTPTAAVAGDDVVRSTWTTATTDGLNVTGNGTAMGYLQNACGADGLICPGYRYADRSHSIISEWNLVCNLDGISDLITSIQMAGIAVGAVLISQLADTFGRKPVWFTTITVNAVVGFASAFAPRWEVYAAIRFFSGICAGGLGNLNFIWPVEFIGMKWRVLGGAINFWQVAVMSLALVAYFIRDWKTLLMVTSLVPTVALWFSYRFLTESPRWLATHNKLEEAKKVLATLSTSEEDHPMPDLMLGDSEPAADEEKSSLRKYSYWDLFRTPLLTRCTLVLMYNWFIYSATYYGLSLNVKNMPGDIYVNTTLLVMLEWPVNVAIVFLNNKIGRRFTHFGFMLAGGIFTFSVMFVNVAGKTEELSGLVTALALVGKAGVAGAWAVGWLFTAELFPTVVRTIGCGAAAFSGRLGGVVAPQVSYLSKVSPALPFIVLGSCSLVGAFLGLLLPETKNRALADELPPWNTCCRRDLDIDDDFDVTDESVKQVDTKSNEVLMVSQNGKV
ncbi:solute carrier family 22 member 15-like [Lingula anatina]|uniref:Solute carrier family 22 member 15-like n=1 Tax=Lingula anatina TaxID=7574 RepID=A0A1S3JTJ4_LINAN|nr:solute carrier family 22 member 15-like [Lingula anatina]XP_013413644.1 solute carrier family 22 member 15-like [Lingula anatina]|eukprot:XP_013413643.1 solute carrier family 22 member 15-like [Lingula anatina]